MLKHESLPFTSARAAATSVLGGQGPIVLREVPLGQISFESLIAGVPRARAQAQVRFVDGLGPAEGYPLVEIERRLGETIGAWDVDAFLRILDVGVASFAVQSLELFDPGVQEIAETIRALTGCRVEVTAFFTPARARASSVHYDKADVVVLQVSGCKLWHLSPPVDLMPSFRSPTIPIPVDRSNIESESVALSPGMLLFLPAGWIHEVENLNDVPSLHLSFVVMADSVISVFSNVVREALASLDTLQWRQRLKPAGMQGDGEHLLHALLSEFDACFRLSLKHTPARFCENVLNLEANENLRREAMRSWELLDSGAENVWFSWVNVHYHAVADKDRINVSIDGRSFFGVRKDLFVYCERARRFSLQSLLDEHDVAEEPALAFIAVLVKRLGLLRVEPSHLS